MYIIKIEQNNMKGQKYGTTYFCRKLKNSVVSSLDKKDKEVMKFKDKKDAKIFITEELQNSTLFAGETLTIIKIK